MAHNTSTQNYLHSMFSYFYLSPLISLTAAQNEDVVEQFLKDNASAGKILYVLKSNYYFLRSNYWFVALQVHNLQFYS